MLFFFTILGFINTSRALEEKLTLDVMKLWEHHKHIIEILKKKPE